MSKAERETDVRETDKWFIENDGEWPRWPFLPLKKYSEREGEFPKLGVIHLSNKARIVFANLFSLPKTYGEFSELPCKEYNSVDEMLEDGWIVD